MSDLPPARIGAFAGDRAASAKPVTKVLHRPQPKPKIAVVAKRPSGKETPARIVISAHERAKSKVGAYHRAAKVQDAKGKAAKGGRKVAKAVAGMTAAKLGLINASGK